MLIALQQITAPDEDEAEAVMFAEFKLPPPAPLEAAERSGVVDTAVQRIWVSAKDLAGLPDLPPSDATRVAVQPKEIWMLLLARLATRGGEIDRKALSSYVAEDFATRFVVTRSSIYGNALTSAQVEVRHSLAERRMVQR